MKPRNFKQTLSRVWMMHWIVLSCTAFCAGAEGDDGAIDKQGQAIYQQHCVECHGDQGQGSDQHSDTLHGDLPVEDLAHYIAETMPEDDPDLIIGDQAQQVARYIYSKFYSPAAQQRLTGTRVELSRLTVRQYQESVADLLGSFRDAPWHPPERGLNANYFASRNWTEDRRLAKQVDPVINFADGVLFFDPTGEYSQLPKKEKKKDENNMNVGFSVYWEGALLVPETGQYTITIESKNGFELKLNDKKNVLIDRMVRSDDVLEHSATVFLLGGRAYPLELNLFSYPDPPAAIRLSWTTPHGQRCIIPENAFMPQGTAESLAVSTVFPADDASSGYERGTSVSQQWDESTTAAAIETANYVVENLWSLAGTKAGAENSSEKVKAFCRSFVERAFAKPLTDEEQTFFIRQHFDNNLSIQDQVRRVVILALKSPRFLYPTLEARDENEDIARQLALVLWDSIPDQQLIKAVKQKKLTDAGTADGERYRMINDPRAKSKLLSFFHYWLKTNKSAEATKDVELYPEFDGQLLNDLQQSLDLYLNDVVWSEKSDFRELFLADYLFVNDRIANFYGLENDTPKFSKIKVDPQQRAGILTHPFLMAGLAYFKVSSPIHRGVFVARNLLGRSLKQPPDNVKPLTEEFNPEMTTRQRVEHQTKEVGCMNCHSVINPLGFSLENFDAVGRFRTAEKEKDIDVKTAYKTPAGETVPLTGARDLANFLAHDANAQRSFIAQLFRYYVKQPIEAYGPDRLDKLHEKFVASEFNIRELLIEISRVATEKR